MYTRIAPLLIFLVAMATAVAGQRRHHSILRKAATGVTDPNSPKRGFKEVIVSSPLDHFDYKNERRIGIRVLINSTFAADTSPPILFYCGNEAPIETFYDNSGLITDYLAPRLNAAVVFAEHRFFGKSFPDNHSTDHDRKYLSVEQTLEDFVTIVMTLKKEYFSQESPVIAFGGSYGGMLAAYFRHRYPHIVTGALAASAPIWQYKADLVSPYWFLARVTEAYEKSAVNVCVPAVRRGLLGLTVEQSGKYELATGRRLAREFLSKPSMKAVKEAFNLCEMPDSTNSLEAIVEWFNDVLTALAMVNYPYAANFYFGAHPSWPVKAFCEAVGSSLKSVASVDDVRLTADLVDQIPLTEIWKAMRKATDVTGVSSAGKCLDQGKPPQDEDDDPHQSWPYLACTSQAMPISSNGVTDMFPPKDFDYNEYERNCQKQFGVRPDYSWGDRFLGTDLYHCTNTAFSNGLLDPWATGTPQRALSSSCPTVWLRTGAHHYDLRGPHVGDTNEVSRVRHTELLLIEQWIDEHRLKIAMATESRANPVLPEFTDLGPVIGLD